MAQRSPHRAVQMADIGRDGNGGKGHDAQIRPQFLGLCHIPEAAHQQEVIQIEVDAEGQHPDTGDNVDICAVVGSHAGVPAGKAAGTGSTEGVDAGIERVHAAQKQQSDHHQRHDKIHTIEDLGGIAHAADQLARRRPRHLCPEDMHGVAVAHRQDRHDEHQHAHAADPMGKAAPQQAAPAEGLHRRQD